MLYFVHRSGHHWHSCWWMIYNSIMIISTISTDRPAHAWFLEIGLVCKVYVFVWLPPKLLITSGVIWTPGIKFVSNTCMWEHKSFECPTGLWEHINTTAVMIIFNKSSFGYKNEWLCIFLFYMCSWSSEFAQLNSIKETNLKRLPKVLNDNIYGWQHKLNKVHTYWVHLDLWEVFCDRSVNHLLLPSDTVATYS